MPAARFDLELVIVTLVMCAVSAMALISVYRSNRDLAAEGRNFRHLLWFGLAAVAFSLGGSVVTTGEFSLRQVLDTLIVRDVGRWVFRAVLPFGYSAIIVGGGGLLVSLQKRRQ